ncbi:hypothetical protein AVEN_255245-1 [Araneus ventricosus]|uniref:RNase H type-1 domain-containing protein n=1 Tax=Araneus ventricosus TaxID=182803 RepID=A0A4Y2B9T3_ARAVE|nr:hypothetical protein AVEN_255245-1 [Araneus ventricosus]
MKNGLKQHFPITGAETDSCLIRLGNQNTVFMAEVIAISRAIDYCIDKNIRNSKLITDSRSTPIAIESTDEKRRFIIEIKKKLKLTKIQLQWVRAHNGTVGNERADALAKLAASKDQIDTEFGLSKAQVSLVTTIGVLVARGGTWVFVVVRNPTSRTTTHTQVQSRTVLRPPFVVWRVMSEHLLTIHRNSRATSGGLGLKIVVARSQ